MTEQKNTSEKVICNAAHRCDFEPCVHKQPHAPKGAGCEIGIGGPKCHSICLGAKIASLCVPVENGRYKIVHQHHCTHCNGKGRIIEEEWIEVKQ